MFVSRVSINTWDRSRGVKGYDVQIHRLWISLMAANWRSSLVLAEASALTNSRIALVGWLGIGRTAASGKMSRFVTVTPPWVWLGKLWLILDFRQPSYWVSLLCRLLTTVRHLTFGSSAFPAWMAFWALQVQAYSSGRCARGPGSWSLSFWWRK